MASFTIYVNASSHTLPLNFGKIPPSPSLALRFYVGSEQASGSFHSRPSDDLRFVDLYSGVPEKTQLLTWRRDLPYYSYPWTPTALNSTRSHTTK